MAIRVDGDRAHGTYENRDGRHGPGTLTGIVNGQILEGKWIDQGGKANGWLRVVLRPSGCGFDGRWNATPETPQTGTLAGVDSNSSLPNDPPGHGPGQCCRPIPANVDSLTLQVPEYLAVAGEEVRVDVWLLRSRDVSNMNWTLTYDPQIVHFIEPAERGNLLNSMFEYNPAQPGLLRFGFAQDRPISEPAGTTAAFRFLAIGPPGSRTPLTLSVSKVNNPAGIDLPIHLIHGFIEIVEKVPEGDCNQDGRLTLQDAQCALKMSVGLIPQRSQVDLDRDTQVTSRDAVILIQRLIPRP